ncbi:MAG: M14 family metallopeptidase, partial [Actinomycetota bacterium]
GKTSGNLPIHLVKIGYPKPPSVKQAASSQTILFICSQHGNEPAGREACLRLLRDLAFTDDKDLIGQLSKQTILFIPNANPDGREQNTRENAEGIDINRDHLNLQTTEAQLMAEVVREWRPDLVQDHHEYGPSTPVVYDDEILYLWPRNLNVDEKVHDLAYELANDYIEPQSEEAGYTADEYGQYEVGDQNLQQTAGDEDEGIMRNAMGLRHSLGILIESAVSPEPRNGPGEVTTAAEVNLRRVESQYVVANISLAFMRERGDEVEAATEASIKNAPIEGDKRSEPVYFYGADNEEPAEDEMQDPPPCGYVLTSKDAADLRATLKLHGIQASARGKEVYVSMAQSAESLIPLLLDERARRHAVAAEPVTEC